MVARSIWDGEVAGSSPAWRTKHNGEGALTRQVCRVLFFVEGITMFTFALYGAITALVITLGPLAVLWMMEALCDHDRF